MTPPKSPEAQQFAIGIAAEIRAEMARQKKTQAQLAEALGITQITASRRMNGTTPFDVEELFTIATWLGVRPEDFTPRPSSAAVNA